jgi:nicotinamide riboside kinase
MQPEATVPVAPSATTPPLAGVVELIGPAGSGKSTLLKELGSRDRRLRTGLALWGLPRRALLAGAWSLAPTILGALLEGRPLRAAEYAQMVRLEALRRAVRRELQRHPAVVVLDEGPIFGLTWLRVFHPRGGRARARWRARAQAAWSALLTLIVRLDARDGVLAQRIRTRQKPHPMKGATDGELDAFSSVFRESFDVVLDAVAAPASVRVLTVRSDATAASAAADQLVRTICGAPDGD